jgi:serine/threonine-protein kinase
VSPSNSTSDAAALRERVRGALDESYRLNRELGRGGAAVVFLAEDLKHGRDVALKLLHPDVGDSFGTDRFLREIRVAARLTHPHILPVLDSGVADGLPYYVMPFVSGETLRDLIDREHRLEPGRALTIVREVADALDYAHAAGIVHRDVKPENILMLGGHAVLADFGIARAMHAAADDNITMAGISVGTPAYMSPEQASGETDIDGRSDQFALAVVLYEALTGQQPYRAPTAVATITRRFAGPPPGVRTVNPELSAAVDAALTRALAVDPADRFDGARAFSQAANGERDAMRGGTAVLPVSPRPVAPGGELPSVAVLPFENASGDSDMSFFSDGVTDEIIGALSRVRNLRVAARSSSFALRAHDARTVGERLGVSAILEGSVRRAGTRVRVTAHLVDAATQSQRWSERYDRELDDVFAIQDDIARRIVETLEVRLFGAAERPMSVSATHSREAHDAYLRGRQAGERRTESGLRESIDHFRAAIAADEGFGPAYVGLADSLALLAVYGIMPPHDVMPLARDAAHEALRRDPTQHEAHVRLGSVLALYDHDWTGADAAFGRAIALSPRSPAAYQRYALDCLVPCGRFDAAIDHIDVACALDPLSPVMRVSAAMVRYFAGDLRGALERVNAAAALDGGFAMADFFLGTIARDTGDYDAAIAALTRAIERTGGTPEMNAGLAQTYARAGDTVRADTIRRTLADAADTRFVSPALFAQIDLASGRLAEAAQWLARAEALADPELVFLSARPAYRALRGTPEFDATLTRIGLPLSPGARIE